MRFDGQKVEVMLRLTLTLVQRGEEVDENTETRVMLLARVQDMRR